MTAEPMSEGLQHVDKIVKGMAMDIATWLVNRLDEGEGKTDYAVINEKMKKMAPIWVERIEEQGCPKLLAPIAIMKCIDMALFGIKSALDQRAEERKAEVATTN